MSKTDDEVEIWATCDPARPERGCSLRHVTSNPLEIALRAGTLARLGHHVYVYPRYRANLLFGLSPNVDTLSTNTSESEP